MRLWLLVTDGGRLHLAPLATMPRPWQQVTGHLAIQTRPRASLGLKLTPPLAGTYLLYHSSGQVFEPRGPASGRTLAFPDLPAGLYRLCYSPVARRGKEKLWRFHCQGPAISIMVKPGSQVRDIPTGGLRPGRLLVRLRNWRGAARGLNVTLRQTAQQGGEQLWLGITDQAGRVDPIILRRGKYQVNLSHRRYKITYPTPIMVRIRPGRTTPVDRRLQTGGIRIRLVDQSLSPLTGRKVPRRVKLLLSQLTNGRIRGSRPITLTPDEQGCLELRNLPAGLVISRPRTLKHAFFLSGYPILNHLATIRQDDFYTTHLVWRGTD